MDPMECGGGSKYCDGSIKFEGSIQSDTESVSSIASSVSDRRGKGRKKKNKRPCKPKQVFGPSLSARELQVIMLDESKAAVELLARKPLLAKLLSKDDIEWEIINYLLDLLAGVSKNWNADAQEVYRYLAELNFIPVHLLLYAMKWRISAIEGGDTVQKLLTVLRTFCKYIPSSYADARLIATVIHDSLRFTDIQIDKIQIQKYLGNCKDLISRRVKHNRGKVEPVNVSEISMLPRGGEVIDPNPPENEKLPPDPSVSNFLGIHYKLRRQEMIDILRMEISKYHSVKRTKGVGEALKECHVYTGVHEHEVITTHKCSGIAIRVQIDAANLTNVNWETTNILRNDSLLCLTTSHFHSVTFATVAQHDQKLLKKGFLDILPVRHEDVMALMSGKHFFMIDTKYSFDETFKVLGALEEMNVDNFPMACHFVYLSAENKRPSHLKKENVKYDIGPVIKTAKTAGKKTVPRTWNINLLDPKEWPSTDHLGVDEYQLNAIQTALTRQVAVITGSPGSGKSYVGLKLVQVLLLNKHRWAKFCKARSDEVVRAGSAGGPVLFISSTRRTLAEFILGVVAFQHTGIVHHGWPSALKALQPFSLEKHREKYKSEMTNEDSTLKEKLNECKNRIENIQANIRQLRKVILPEEVLRPVIEPTMYKSFMDGTETASATLILDWLLCNDVSEAEMKCLKEDIPLTAKQFTSKRDIHDDAWLETKLPCVVILDEARVHCNTKKEICKKVATIDKVAALNMKPGDNLWELTIPNRWRLYRKWLMDIEFAAMKRQETICKEMAAVSSEHQKLRDEVDENIFRNASVIGMTTSMASRCRRALQHANPYAVVVEDSADIIQSTTVTCIPANLQHLVLIGDVPMINNFSAARKLAKKHNVDTSLTQHFVKNDYAVCKLEMQHRMSPTVSKISRLVTGDEYQNHSSVINLPAISGLEHSVFFIDHNDTESSGLHEATFLVALFIYLIQQGYSRNQIVIITTLPVQHQHFRKENISDRVICADNFQGESDIVLFMCSGSERNSMPGRLLKDQRLLFILTRARMGLYLVGDFSFLASESVAWARILQEARRLEWVGSSLKLTCPYHPGVPTDVSTAEELKERNERKSCGLPCQARLECGHCCKSMCHDHDVEKASVICNQICNRVICDYGHKCTNLCSQPCNTKCKGKVEKKLPCGHHQLLPCYQPPEKAKCKDKCERLLPCGHRCIGICYEKCKEGKCNEKTKKSHWPCGHSVVVPCRDGPETCPEPCGVVLACGHPCSGTCGKCQRGRLHIVCNQPCGRTLVCGHPCESRCATQCPPCTRRCENRCQHSDCRKICGEACIPCRESCLWRCPHLSCPNMCGEPCDRKPCDEPCTKSLPCGHECIGMCGEKCPTKCRVCDEAEVTEILFGSEDEEDARFVQLEDCGHVIEVEALDHYMNMSQDTDDSIDIQLKGCPKCKTPIRRNLRYGNIIKQTLADVENVKTKIRGARAEIESKMTDLKKKMAELRQHAAYRDEFVDEEDLTDLSAGLTTMPHVEKVLARFNRCVFLGALADLRQKTKSVSHSRSIITRRDEVWKGLDELKEMIVRGDLDRFTDQQMDDLQKEISRLNVKTQLIILLQKDLPSLHYNLQKSAVRSLDALVGKGTPFTKDDEKRAQLFMTQVRHSLGCTVLGISDEERIQIVRAIGLSQGHWYKCPRGHVYAIGECGGAMEKGNCPECGAAIGGQSHQLTSGNRVAREMDGARQAAWPTGQGQNDMPFQMNEMEFDQEEIEEQHAILQQIQIDQERRRIERHRFAGMERLGVEMERIQAAERLRGERVRADRLRAERERADRLRAERERADRLRAEREMADRLRAEREMAERLRAEREMLERARAERSRAERERLARERTESIERWIDEAARNPPKEEKCTVS